MVFQALKMRERWWDRIRYECSLSLAVSMEDFMSSHYLHIYRDCIIAFVHCGCSGGMRRGSSRGNMMI